MGWAGRGITTGLDRGRAADATLILQGFTLRLRHVFALVTDALKKKLKKKEIGKDKEEKKGAQWLGGERKGNLGGCG